MKGTFISIAGFILLLVLVVFLNVFDLEMFKFFEPKRENARREVFENTQSYVQGMTQDLARYYRQYQTAKSEEDKTMIKGVIREQFASFDASKLNSIQLQNFLTNMRGY